MPSPQAKSLQVSSLQQELLQQIIHRTTSAQRLVKRAQIAWEALKGSSNSHIAQHLQIDEETARRWRDRWHAAESRLQATEESGKQASKAKVATSPTCACVRLSSPTPAIAFASSTRPNIVRGSTKLRSGSLSWCGAC